MTSDSHLEKILSGGDFAVTAECGPPRGADPEVIQKKGMLLKNCVDAVNVTDNQTAVVRMSSLSGCVILKQMGITPVFQMVTRDRNRIAIQSDILGAAALGINTILCLSGDHQRFGDHPQAMNVYDIDSINLIHTVKQMRDEGKFLGGDDIKGKPRFFIGASANPSLDPFELQEIQLAKKVAAGAQFIQTQCIFNLDRFTKWMRMVKEEGFHEKVHILGGVMPIKSLRMATFLKTGVPGMDVPDDVIARIQGVPKEKQAEEGIKLCIETINRLKELEGVHGVHIMAIEWEETVPRIVKEAGLLPRPAAE